MELAREILCELNPKLHYRDFEILEKIDNDSDFDLFEVADFETFILEENLDQILSRMICDWLPYRVMYDKNFEIDQVVKFDWDSKKVVILSEEFQGSYYIKEQIKKMNDRLSNGESKV